MSSLTFPYICTHIQQLMKVTTFINSHSQNPLHFIHHITNFSCQHHPTTLTHEQEHHCMHTTEIFLDRVVKNQITLVGKLKLSNRKLLSIDLLIPANDYHFNSRNFPTCIASMKIMCWLDSLYLIFSLSSVSIH